MSERGFHKIEDDLNETWLEDWAGAGVAEIEAYLAKQIRFDPDLWIVEVEDRAGRHFLDHIVR